MNRIVSSRVAPTIVLFLVCVSLAGCREEEEKPEEVSAQSRPVEAEAGLPEEREKPVATTAKRVESARMILNSAEEPDSARLAAAAALMVVDLDRLVAAYGEGEDARIVRALIEERVERRDEAVLPLLVRLFRGVEGEERIDFEEYLLNFGRKAEPALLRCLREEDPALVMRAMDALVKMRSPVAADSLALLLDHEETWVRIGAAHAIGELGGEGAVERLVGVLDDSVYSVVDAALVGLGRLKGVQAFERILVLTDSGNPHVRKHAALALGELGDPRGLAAVRRLATEDADPGVRFMAGKALKKLEEGG